MSRRSPSTSRFVRRVRRTVRSSLETLRSLIRVSHRSDTAGSGSRLADEPYPAQCDRNGPGDRRDRTDRPDRDRGTATRLESDPGPSSDSDLIESRPSSDSRSVGSRPSSDSRPGSKAALLDPDTGPTSCSEILEHGCLPAQYVRAVLADHGGRLKQRRLVDEYGWSPSTLSELLSTLEDEGAIERYRIGREKVIRLPDEERQLAPTAGESRK